MRKNTIALFVLLLLHLGINAQQPTMQVAANLGGKIEYLNLFNEDPGWLFSGSLHGGNSGQVTEDNGYRLYSGTTETIKFQALAYGYPLYSPFKLSDDKSYYYSKTVSFNENGQYTLIVKGKGAVYIQPVDAANFIITQNSNSVDGELQITFTVQGVTAPDSSGYPAFTGSGGSGYASMYIRLEKSDTLNPITSIVVLPPDYTDKYGKNFHFPDMYDTMMFHPRYIEDLQKYSCLRFMDAVKTNSSDVVHWSQTAQPDVFVRKPNAYANCISLGNATNRDIWLNIPHLAADGFVDTLATLIKENLKPGLKAYIEYTNEAWNSIFGQTQWTTQMGQNLGWFTDPNDKYYVRRSGEIFKIMAQKFGSERNRLMLVCAWQNGSFENFGTFYNDPLINPSGFKPDAFATAPYFGDVYTPDEIGVVGECLHTSCAECVATAVPSITDIIDDMRYDIQNKVSTNSSTLRNNSVKYNVAMINYEGGPHAVGGYGAENSCELSDVLMETNRSPEMYDTYYEWIDTLRSRGILMMNQYTECGVWSKWGSWGLKEYRFQNLSSPKYKALVDWQTANPTVFDTQVPTKPGTPVKTESKSTSATIEWTASTDNGYIVGYDIFVNGQYHGTAACAVNVTTYKIMGLQPNTSYNVSVKARDFGGNYSLESEAAVVSTQNVDVESPTAVINLKNIYQSYNLVKLSWSASSDNDAVTEYIVVCNDKVYATPEVSYQLEGLTPQTYYKISVLAKDPSGNISDTSFIEVTTDAFPVLKAQKTSTPVTIDGLSNESAWITYYEVNKLVTTTDSYNNDTIKVGALWDNTHLYLSLKAYDPNQIKSTLYYIGDAFEVLIDGNYNRSTSFENGFDLKYTVQWTNPALYGSDTNGIVRAQTTTDSSWVLEMAIPWSKMGITSPANDLKIGFNIIYDDADVDNWKRNRQLTFSGDQSIYTSCEQFADLVLIDDLVLPTSPSSLSVVNITAGSATLTWASSSDAAGIKGYHVVVDGQTYNSAIISGNSINIVGLSPSTSYDIKVVAVDSNDNVSPPATTNFSTSSGNTIVHFDGSLNTTTNYSMVRTDVDSSSFSVVPFTTADSTELYGNIPLYDKQYEIKGAYKYEFQDGLAVGNTYPSIKKYTGNITDGSGSIYIFTGENTASSFTGCWIWTKDKFMNGNDTASNVGFDNTESSRLSVNFIYSTAWGTARFVVKSGDLYYISEAVFVTGKDANLNTRYTLTAFGNSPEVNKRWAVYDPASLKMPAINELTFKAVDLSNVTEIGIFFTVGRPAYSYNIGMAEFQVHGIQKALDTQAPSAPASLVANYITDSTFVLGWNHSSDNQAVAYYRIFKDNVEIGTSMVNQFVVTNLTTNTVYEMEVQAVDNAGNLSAMSAPLMVNTLLTENASASENTALSTKIWSNGKRVYISNPIPGEVYLYDVYGRLMLIDKSYDYDSASTVKVINTQLKPGIYIVKTSIWAQKVWIQ